MAFIGRAAHRAASKEAKKQAKQQAQSARKIEANRKASENALFFGNSRAGQDAWAIAMGKGKREFTRDERIDLNREYRQTGSSLRKDLEKARENMKKATKPEEKQKYQDEMRNIGAQLRDHRQTNPAGMTERDYTTGERFSAAGTALGEYYFGGTGKQMAARMGATGGAIIGVPVGIGMINDAASGRSGSRPPGY